jgi:hypothetical protein
MAVANKNIVIIVPPIEAVLSTVPEPLLSPKIEKTAIPTTTIQHIHIFYGYIFYLLTPGLLIAAVSYWLSSWLYLTPEQKAPTNTTDSKEQVLTTTIVV